MRLTPRTLRIVPFGCSFLTALTNHHRGVEIKSIVVENHFRKEPTEQIAEHALIDGLRKFVEISLVSPMVCTAFPTEQITQSSIIAYHIKVPETVCTTPNARKQAQY